MQNVYNNINSPEELLDFMNNNFSYGYVDFAGGIHDNFDADWINDYCLQIDDDLLKNKVGCCFDAVEFERLWFKKHNYEFITIFEMVKLDYLNNYPMHAFLIYKRYNKWHYFEWADGSNQGIFSFTSFCDVVEYQYKHYLDVLDNLNIKDEEKNKVIRYVYDEPNARCNGAEYLKFVVNGEVLESRTIK